MENPMTWTDLHRAINSAYYDRKIDANDREARALAVYRAIQLNSDKHLYLSEINEVLDEHQDEMLRHMCGLSLCSKLVNKLNAVNRAI